MKIMENNKIESYVYKTNINGKYTELYLTKDEFKESCKQKINPIVTLMAKHNAIKQGKIFDIGSINLKYIDSFEFDSSVEGLEFWSDISSKFKEPYFEIGKSFFTLSGKIIKIQKIIIESIKDTDYTIWIKFDNGTVVTPKQIDEFLNTTNKWYKDNVIHNPNCKIRPEVYKKLYAYPISVIRYFLDSLWLNNNNKRGFFNIFILDNPIETLVKRFCYDKSWFTNTLLNHDYTEYYINVGENILKEDLEYFKEVLFHNPEYELPEYFKSKYNKNNKTENFSICYEYINEISDINEYYLTRNYKDFKEEDFNILYNKFNSKKDGRQEFKSRENGKDGRSENQLQGENTAESCYRFAERSELFGGRYQSSITNEDSFGKKRTSKNKSVLRNS